MRFLRPLFLRPRYHLRIQEQINDIFEEVLYAPLRAALRRHGYELKNTSNPVAEAIAAERIFYAEGAFYGDFNSKISRQLQEYGAVYDGRKKAWVIAEHNLPAAILQELRTARLRFQLFRTDILDTLKVVEKKKIPPINYLPTVEDINADLIKSLKSFAIPTILSPRAEKIIAKEWGENLDLFIKDWLGENIIKLRKEVMSNTLVGTRAEALHSTLQDNYGVSKTKARFLARQETSLLMSKIRQTGYEDVGITDYIWDVAGGDEPDERVRELHRELNGKRFSFANPPVSGTNGEKLNPGEPFGCRCTARPIAESAFDENAKSTASIEDVAPPYSPE